MPRLAMLTLLLLPLAASGTPAQAVLDKTPDPPETNEQALADALTRSMRPALPFPPAQRDGTPASGGVEPVWTVRWPAPGEARIEVLANPLNAENSARALAAEKEIQKAAMQAQRQSQGDYDRALSEFQRTGRASDIREVSLSDDGVAGERYDAESQLMVTAEPIGPGHAFSVASSSMPVTTSVEGATVVVRVAANAYQQPAADGLPGTVHYCPEQAWVFLGALGTPEIRPGADATFEVVFPAMGGAGARGAMAWISGNTALVEQVLRQADWSALAAFAGR